MSNRYFSGRKGHYIFCDICGQACYDWEITVLDSKTGRGGCIVCPKDADSIDYGIIPYALPVEKSVKFARMENTDVTNEAAPIVYETATNLGV